MSRLHYVTSPLTNLHRYRHFSIQYEFYASAQIQTIIKGRSARQVVVEQMLHGHTRLFFEFGYPGSVE